ncbi:sensor histidine kinase [Virgibacillus salexigens]|uniref:sensor histidine kinase n=1 Tax=Virgibacillus salexigens TaxID=61016 RepID=UPI0019096B08|nr:ATP-binding protein [Virgibacillus salexigens]
MSQLRKTLKILLPDSFLWRLTFLHFIVIGIASLISGWALYHTACFLAAGVGNLGEERQQQFNQSLFHYVWMFILIAVIAGTILYFYLTKRLLKPIHELINATRLLKKGNYPQPIAVSKKDEIGLLVEQYNQLIQQLNKKEQDRKKLVSDISHEFRTPLSNLNGYLFALKSEDITGDNELFEALYQESKRLTSMLEQFEQLKQWDHTTSTMHPNKQLISIKQVIEQSTSMFTWSLKQADIQLLLNVEDVHCLIYPEGLQQVINNLLDNAIRYYRSPGSIRVSGKQQDNYYNLTVSGPSETIPEGEKEQIFERLYRIERSRSRETGGAGLGLAITKEIVEQHNGYIYLDTSEGENSFHVYLPI